MESDNEALHIGPRFDRCFLFGLFGVQFGQEPKPPKPGPQPAKAECSEFRASYFETDHADACVPRRPV